MDTNAFSDILKKRLLKLLQFSISFFERHSLRYYGCGGTVLGAVRHQGFIPWDDDIDLYMPREDYDRLIGLNEELQKEGRSFVCFENDKDYYLPFGKIVCNNTSLWEVEEYPYMLGVYIDIFPLDYFDLPDEKIVGMQFEFLDVYHRYQSTQQELSFKTCVNQVYYGGLMSFFKMLGGKASLTRKTQYYDQVIDYLDRIRNNKGPKTVCLTQWEGKVFNTEWFDNFVLMPFESVQLKVPRDYDSYLKLLYGDYMTPPPPSLRVPQHEDVRHYVNLKERISINEARNRLSKGEKLVY